MIPRNELSLFLIGAAQLRNSLFSFLSGVGDKINRNWEILVRKYVESDADAGFVKEIKDYLYSFTNSIEYRHEEEG